MFTANAVIRQYNAEHMRRSEEETQATELAAYIAEIGLYVSEHKSAFNPNNFLRKMVTFCAKKVAGFIIKRIIKGVIKNMVKAAFRLFWNVLRIGVAGVMRYVAMPILQGALAMLVNPATLTVLSTVGLGYAAWKYLLPDDLKRKIVSGLEDVSSPLVDIYEKTYGYLSGTSVVYKSKSKQVPAPTERFKSKPVAPTFKAPDLSKIKASGAPDHLPDEVEGYVQEAAKEVGIPVNDLRGLIYYESKGVVNAESPTGALGIGQFITSTWNDFARKYPQYASWGLTPTATAHRYTDDPRRNPRASALASALFIRENAAAGFSDPFDSYLIYNLGPATAKKLLRGQALDAGDWGRINAQFGSAAERIRRVGDDSAEAFLAYWRDRYYGQYKRVNQNAPAAASNAPSLVVLPKKEESKPAASGDYFNIVQLPNSNLFMKAS